MVINHRKEYLKTGVIIVIDVPHQWNLWPRLVLERVAEKMGIKYPSNSPVN